MSKCDLMIQLEKSDRTFQAGDIVRGTVFVNVNKAVRCNGLIVSALYKTSGKGNPDQREYETLRVFEGEWQAGQQHSFPFEIEIPPFPTTYHGSFLNIDHMIRARADIPWAFDPKTTQEFLVVPGGKQGEFSPAHEVPTEAKTSKAGLIIGALVALSGMVFAVFTFGISLIGTIIGALIIFASMRKSMAQKKLGIVTLNGIPTMASPGETIDLQIQFSPKSTGRINRITLQIHGREQCVSGSGTNKTTHTHVLHKELIEIGSNIQMTFGETCKFPVSFQMPDGQAYSISMGSNKIIWDCQIHVDIPRWPDWVHTQPFHMVPAQVTNSEFTPVDVPPPVLADSGIPPQKEIVHQDIYEGSIEDPGGYAAAPSQSASQTPQMRTDLAAVAQTLSKTGRFSDEAQNLVNELATDFFEVKLVVERVGPSYGSFQDESYKNGRTIFGIVQDTNCDIQLQLPESYNREIELLDPGEVWTGRGVIIKWDGLYERLEVMGL